MAKNNTSSKKAGQTEVKTVTIENKYFTPYQIRWLNDDSKIKVWEKSRRIGATYVQSYEDVTDIISAKVLDVWFSSADESAAKEYILYCEKWAKLFDAAARTTDDVVLDKDNDVKATVIEFANGGRITALTSNPKRFRSKGGKVVLDEFAHHEDQAAMWKAAKPSTMWGFPIRILSTHNGKKSLFNKNIEKIKKGKLNWSLHTTNIFTAIKEGLLDKILKKKTTPEEQKEWLAQERKDSLDETTWQEEYCCNAQDEGAAFIPRDQIELCAQSDILWQQDIIPTVWNGADSNIKESKNVKSIWVHEKIAKFKQWVLSIEVNGNLFLGFDIARRKDLSVIMVIEKIGSINITRGYFVFEKMKFWVQQDIVFALLSHPKLYRGCIDETGIGMQLAENCVDEFGDYKVEAINFASGNIRNEMAFDLKNEIEDRTILIPDIDDIKDDIHSIKKTVTFANKIRLEQDNQDSDVTGHADRFWGLGLAIQAGKDSNTGPLIVSSGGKREMIKNLDKY